MRHKSRQELETFVVGTPNSVMAQFYLGTRRYEALDIEGAAFCFERVNRLNSAWDIAHYDYGMALFRLQRFMEAERHFELALRLNPALVQATFMLGYTLLAKGNFGDGVEQMKQAIRQSPKELQFHWGYGYNLLRMNQWEEAIPVLKQALLIREADADIHASLGEALLFQGEVEGAKKHLDRSLQLNAKALPTLALRYICDLNSNATPETLQKIEKVLQQAIQAESVHSGQFWFYLGQIYRQRDKTREAFQSYRNAIHSGFSSELLFFGLSETAEQLGKKLDAQLYRDEYERLQSLRSQIPLLAQHVLRVKDDTDAHLALARAYRSFQFRQKAMTEYYRYLQLIPTDSKVLEERKAYFQQVHEALRHSAPLSLLPKLL